MEKSFQIKKPTVFVGIVIIILVWGIGSYNSLVSTQQSVSASFSQINTDLQRRFDLIPNLVSTVKGITKQENEVFTKLAEARTRYSGAVTDDQKIAATNDLQAGIGRLLVISENYPQLRSSEAFNNLMTQLEGTENRIAVSRKDYNNTVSVWNTKVSRFPTVVIAKIFNFKQKEFFNITDEAKVNPKVDFN